MPTSIPFQMYEFYTSLRELQIELGKVQAQLVAAKVLCTPNTVDSVRIESASESEIVDVLVAPQDTLVNPAILAGLLHVRELGIALARSAENILLNAKISGSFADIQRTLITIEFTTLLETIDVMISRFFGDDKKVSRKYGPNLSALLHPG